MTAQSDTIDHTRNHTRRGAELTAAALTLTVAAAAGTAAGLLPALAVAVLGLAAIPLGRTARTIEVEPVGQVMVLILVATLAGAAARYDAGFPGKLGDAVGWTTGGLDGRVWFVCFVVAPVTTLLLGTYLVARRMHGDVIAAWSAVLFGAADGVVGLAVAGALDWTRPVVCGLVVAGSLTQLLLATRLAQQLLGRSHAVRENVSLKPAPDRRQLSLWTVLLLGAVGVYGTALYSQAGLLPVGVVVGSMVGGLIGWRRTTACDPADPAVHVPLFLLLLALFYLHVGEEALTYFNRDIGQLTGRPWSDADFTLLIGLLGPAVWVLAAWSLWRRQVLGNFIYWFLIVGMILGEPTHLLVFPVARMVQDGVTYGYFSGMWTALFPMIPAVLGLAAILRRRRLVPEPQR